MKLTAPEMLSTLTKPGMRCWVETTPATFDRDRQPFYQAASRNPDGRAFEITAFRAVGHAHEERTHMLLRITRVT